MKKLALLTGFIFCMAVVCMPVYGDDTDVYGVKGGTVEPNILIIFDTSGSMGYRDIKPDAAYDSTKDYKTINGTSYNKNYVYTATTTATGSWYQAATSISAMSNGTAKTLLQSNSARVVYGVNLNYSNSNRYYVTGNYLSWMRTRMEVAKESVTEIIKNTTGVRFGLMKFRSSSPYGGQMVKYIAEMTDSNQSALIAAVKSLTANGGTPLAESLAEAGLYFAGQTSWFNSGTSYSKTQPIENAYPCRKNYVILMTDGEPTNYSGTNYTNNYTAHANMKKTYLNNKTIDNGSYPTLDKVAKFLYENDCSGGKHNENWKQNIVTYTIGFATDQKLLKTTAESGGGSYYTANSVEALATAFESIISSIQAKNAIFVAPVIPVSQGNRAFSGDSMYVGFFKPQQSGRWYGNIKKYGLDASGNMIDVNGAFATEDGLIQTTAQSAWGAAADGPEVEQGGVGALLKARTDSRKLYTYLGNKALLTDAANAFSTANTALTAARLDVGNATERAAVINDIIGTPGSNWRMGDVLHSQPVVFYESATKKTYFFVGTNGGVMHMFDDHDGQEAWGFIPPSQLPRLKKLSDSDTTHDYFVDGASIIYEGTNTILFFGERRGGSNYYALNITTPTAPFHEYTLTDTLLSNGEASKVAATLGQSWATPKIHKIRTVSDGTDTIFLLSGGYDEGQDAKKGFIPSDYKDTKGKAVFGITVTDGMVGNFNFNAASTSTTSTMIDSSTMEHCIVDVMGFDSNNDGLTDRIYAGDLGGNIWAFEDHKAVNISDTSTKIDGLWTGRKLFADDGGRKIFAAPDVVMEYTGDMIFFGTGDRENPLNVSGTRDRIYAIRNYWEASPITVKAANAVTELYTDEAGVAGKLINVTANIAQLGSEKDRAKARVNISGSRGWFFDLENEGEKITSSVLVYAGVLYFTTFTPSSSDVNIDVNPCATTSGTGVARLYAVDYLTGQAVYDYDSTVEKDADGKTVQFGKKDRSTVIGSSIPSAPVIAVLNGKTVLYVGVEGGVVSDDPIESQALNRFYWRQVIE